MCSRSRSRSKVTWYGHFCDFTKIAYSRRQMAGSRPNLHTMVPTWACIQRVLKVKVKFKGHVIRALLWCHEMFALQYLLTFCLYIHSLYEAPLYFPSSTSVRQLDVMSTSWNELLCHWRSGIIIVNPNSLRPCHSTLAFRPCCRPYLFEDPGAATAHVFWIKSRLWITKKPTLNGKSKEMKQVTVKLIRAQKMKLIN